MRHLVKLRNISLAVLAEIALLENVTGNVRQKNQQTECIYIYSYSYILLLLLLASYLAN